MTGRRFVLAFGMVATIGLAALLADSFAQEAAPSESAPSDPAAKRVDDDSGRLPPGYSAIVKKSQRTEIYAIQDRYQKQIEDVHKQIALLEQKRDEEIANILTDEQVTILAFILKLREDEKKEESKAVTTAEASGDASN